MFESIAQESVSDEDVGGRFTPWCLRPWWTPRADSGLTATHVHETAVDIDCLNGDPKAGDGKGSGRRAVRLGVLLWKPFVPDNPGQFQVFDLKLVTHNWLLGNSPVELDLQTFINVKSASNSTGLNRYDH